MQPGMMMGGTDSSQQRGGPMMQGDAQSSKAPRPAAMPSLEEMWRHQQEMQGWMNSMQGMMGQMLQHEQQRWRHHNHSD